MIKNKDNTLINKIFFLIFFDKNKNTELRFCIKNTKLIIF